MANTESGLTSMTTPPSRIRIDDPSLQRMPGEAQSTLNQLIGETQTGLMGIRPFLHISPETTICRTIELMYDADASGVLIVQANQVLGIVTERDILQRATEQYERISQQPVSEIMTPCPASLKFSDSVQTAIKQIAQFRHIPVVDQSNQPLGILTPYRAFEFVDALLTEVATR